MVTGKGKLGGIEVMGVVFVIVGFAFKVSAVPFHTWAPDTYEGAPTPVTAFLSVASKAAGFVALILLVYLAFPQATDVYRPFMWVMAALTMTVGNVVALRQTNIVRLLAYSSIAQGGFILMPLVVAGSTGSAEPSLRAIVVYLIIYAATNLGAFAVVIAVSRKTRSGEISSYGGLFGYAPGLAVLMTDLPRLVGRHSAARRLVREVRRLQRGADSTERVGIQHRRDRCHQRRDRHRVLRHDHA